MQGCFVFQHILLWKDIHLEHQLWGNSVFQWVDLGEAGSPKSYSDMETDRHCLTSKKGTDFTEPQPEIQYCKFWSESTVSKNTPCQSSWEKRLIWKMWPSLASSESWSAQLMVSLIAWHGSKMCHFCVINVDLKMWSWLYACWWGCKEGKDALSDS